MTSHWKLLLGILLALMVTGCAAPSTAASPNIYFDLARDPIALVNELGVDAIVDGKNTCYTLISEKTAITGWVPIYVLDAVYADITPFPTQGNDHLPSGSAALITGACMDGADMRKHNRMSAWLYQKGDEPNRNFAVYSDNIDPAAASLHLPVTTAALASSPFQVRVKNTSSMTISVPLNCLVTDGREPSGDLALAHLEWQTSTGWEVFQMNFRDCFDYASRDLVGEEWLDIVPQTSETVDLRNAYPTSFALEKGRYRWVTTFCAMFSSKRRCYTSFSATFDYLPEQASK